MARHKLSAMFSDLRGKLNGSKFSKSRSCHTLTNKVKGTNPQTPTQGSVRSAFRYFSSKWKNLSVDQITSWNLAANEIIKRNAFGDNFKTTGHKLFIQTNVQARLCGVSSTIYGPSNPSHPHYLGEISGFKVHDAGTTPPGHMTFSISEAVPTGCFLKILVTAPFSGGISNFKGRFRTLKILPQSTGAGTFDIETEYTNKHGAVPAGKKVACTSHIIFNGDFQHQFGNAVQTDIG